MEKLSTAYLAGKEKKTCFALTNNDLKSLRVVDPISFLRDENSGRKGKPVTIFSTMEDSRDFVTSTDLFNVRRYKIVSVKNIEPIVPEVEIERVKCPACGNSFYVTHPKYVPDGCPNGCRLHPGKWIVERTGGEIDVARGHVLLRSKSRGTQVVKFYIDGVNLDVNNNHAKMQLSRSGAGSLYVDAIPFKEWNGKTFDFALWITWASLDFSTPGTPAVEIEFTIDTPPTNEKGTVQTAFNRNYEFMRVYLGFESSRIQTAFPDMILRCWDGTKKVVEFEFESRNFDKHKHDARFVDYIICWIDNRKPDSDGVTVIALNKLVGKKIMVVDGV